MRKSLLIGSLLAIFLILMLPAVSATESSVVRSFQKDAYLEAIRAKYANDPSPQLFFLLKFVIKLLKLIITLPILVLLIYLRLILLP
jgi:hypothetical protein